MTTLYFFILVSLLQEAYTSTVKLGENSCCNITQPNSIKDAFHVSCYDPSEEFRKQIHNVIQTKTKDFSHHHNSKSNMLDGENMRIAGDEIGSKTKDLPNFICSNIHK